MRTLICYFIKISSHRQNTAISMTCLLNAIRQSYDTKLKPCRENKYIGGPEGNATFFWPVTMLGMWDFRLNKFKVSSIYVQICKAFWPHHSTMESMICGTNVLWQNSLLLRKNQCETSTHIFAMFMEVLWSSEAPVVNGWRAQMFPEQEKQSSMICLRPSCHNNC